MRKLSLLLLVALFVWSTANSAIFIGSNVTTGWSTESSVNGVGGTRAICEQYNATGDANITSLGLYHPGNDDHDVNIKLFLLNSSGLVLGQTAPISVPLTGPQFISGSITSAAVTNAATYYICAMSDGLATGRIGIMNDGTSGNFVDSSSGTYASPPSTFSALGADGGNMSSLFYADGTAAAAGATNVIMIQDLGKTIGPHKSQQLGGLLEGH